MPITSTGQQFNSTTTIGLDSGVMATGQFFVTWAVFTLFYGIIAVAVYVFTTANIQLEWLINYLVITVSWYCIIGG